MKKIIKILLIGIFVFGIGAGAIYKSSKKVSLEKYAESIVSKCKSEENKSVCYETEVPKLMKKISMEEAFIVTTIVQDKDQSFPYCHTLGHKLASIETAKDPSKWKDVVARCPSGTCSNGCVHGAFQEKYKNDTLIGLAFEEAEKELENLCEDSTSFNPTGLEQGSCYHALGHLLMYITDADINKSVDTCDQLAKKSDGRDYSGLCYDGSFMQIFQPLDTDDQSLVRNFSLNKENTWDFCNKFTGERRTSCWTESWPIYLDQISTSEGLTRFCSKLDSRGKESCFSDIFYIMPIQFRFNIDDINRYCSGFSQPYQSRCFTMTALRILEIDKRNTKKTVDYCNNLMEGNRNECFNEVVKSASFDFHIGSEEFSKLCLELPEPWKTQCQGKNK